MATLRARIGGQWVDVTQPPTPVPNEVFVGPTEPVDPDVELWVDEDAVAAGGGGGLTLSTDAGNEAILGTDGGLYVPPGVELDTGSYVPVLTGITLGTGTIKNDACWSYVGSMVKDEYGILSVQGEIVLGTGGAVTAPVVVSLPPAYKYFTLAGVDIVAGVCVYNTTDQTLLTDAYPGFVGPFTPGGNTAMGLHATVFDAASSRLMTKRVGPGVPFVWGEFSSIRWGFTCGGRRAI